MHSTCEIDELRGGIYLCILIKNMICDLKIYTKFVVFRKTKKYLPDKFLLGRKLYEPGNIYLS